MLRVRVCVGVCACARVRWCVSASVRALECFFFLRACVHARGLVACVWVHVCVHAVRLCGRVHILAERNLLLLGRERDLRASLLA